MYIFYDLETSGLDKDFCQILQIAMIFADLDLNLMSSKNLKCRRLPWVIPSPGAMLITGMTPDDLKNADLSHFELMETVDKWLHSQHWPLTFMGYNIMGFDEGVLRQNRHQTLYDPYITTGRKEWKSRPNKRADVYHIVQATHLYAPKALTLKKKTAKGNITMSLGSVAEQNGIHLGDDAHDALADTKATIAVAKYIREKAPDIWNHMMSLTSAKDVESFFGDNQVFAHSTRFEGGFKSFFVTAVADNKNYKAENVTFNLSFDPKEYIDLSVKELSDLMQIKWKDRFTQPFHKIRKNTHPIVIPVNMADAIYDAKEMPSKQEMAERAELIANSPEFKEKIAQAAAMSLPEMAKKSDIETQIFDFPSSTVRKDLDKWMADFRKGDWDKRKDLIQNFPKWFEEGIKEQPTLKRFVQFAQRIMYAEAPEMFSDKALAQYDSAIHKRITETSPDVAFMTIEKARQELKAIEEERNAGGSRWDDITDSQIRSLKLYYTSLEKELATNAPEKKPLAKSFDDNTEQKKVSDDKGGVINKVTPVNKPPLL